MKTVEMLVQTLSTAETRCFSNILAHKNGSEC
jgi:hypothetical protein